MVPAPTTALLFYSYLMTSHLALFFHEGYGKLSIEKKDFLQTLMYNVHTTQQITQKSIESHFNISYTTSKLQALSPDLRHISVKVCRPFRQHRINIGFCCTFQTCKTTNSWQNFYMPMK